MARGSGTRKGGRINMTKEDTDKEDDGGSGGNDAPGGDQAESGGTVGAADSHISDADSGTAGIADEMSVQKEGSPDHRDHGEGSTTDTAEPAGDTVPEGVLSNPNSISPALVAVPSEVVDHIIPVAVCSDFWDKTNWQALWRKCNIEKGNKDKRLINGR